MTPSKSEKPLIETIKQFEDLEEWFYAKDVAEAVKRLKKKLSKYMLLDGYMAKGVSMNIILDEIFGTFADDKTKEEK